jgi:integrase
MYHHRDLYIFAAYSGGIRISDLLQLKWENFDGTHIRLNTQKTKETISIKLPTKALEIIEVYSKSQPDNKPEIIFFPF